MTSIPVVDLAADNAAARVRAACRKYGFVSIIGHGISAAQFAEMRTMLRDLFALDEPPKRAAMITPHNYRGFIPLGFFTPNRTDLVGIERDHYEG